jgi:DNA invertase Pin-like site-specific DNA recombinase
MKRMRLAEQRIDAPLPGRAAVGYLRRSTDRQEQSLADQRRAIQDHADCHGFEIVDWYSDDAISGASVDARQAFRQMLADAQDSQRSWRFVLVYDVSRFSRGDLDKAGHLRYQFRKAGVEVVYVNENLTGGDADDLVVGVKQWMAQKYVKDLSVTTIRGQVSHSESGAWCGGTPPYGYDLLYHDSNGRPYQRLRWLESGEKEIYDPADNLIRILPRGERQSTSKRDVAKLVPSTPDRVRVLLRIFREYVEEGRGCKNIADGLNRDGIPSPRNGKWSSNAKAKWSLSTIRAIVRNPAYRGDTVWNRRTFAKFNRVRCGVAEARTRIEASKPRQNPESEWIVVPGTHEPLVPPTVFDRAQQLMKSRRQGAIGRNPRAGSGQRSPYLLSGLVICGRCGQNYQGRTINSSKRRKDGSKIKTLYYACGGYVMKGRAACEKFLLRKAPLEGAILKVIQGRLDGLLNGDGERILRAYINEEIANQGADPRREMATLRARLEEIDQKASALLETMSPETKGFIDTKLRELGPEKRKLQRRLEELEAAPYQKIDADAVLQDGLAAIRDLPRLLDDGSLEERKEFIRAFVAGVTVLPDETRLDLRVRQLPAVWPENSSVGVVAGAGFEPATFGL